LRLCAEGLEEKQIAERIGKSHHTVHGEKAYIFEKLGAANIAHAVHLAHQRGLL